MKSVRLDYSFACNRVREPLFAYVHIIKWLTEIVIEYWIYVRGPVVINFAISIFTGGPCCELSGPVFHFGRNGCSFKFRSLIAICAPPFVKYRLGKSYFVLNAALSVSVSVSVSIMRNVETAPHLPNNKDFQKAITANLCSFNCSARRLFQHFRAHVEIYAPTRFYLVIFLHLPTSIVTHFRFPVFEIMLGEKLQV